MRFAIIVAAGQGRRMGYKKQFIDMVGRPMWVRSMEAMFSGGAEQVVVVTSEDDLAEFRDGLASSSYSERVSFRVGGETRHASVVSGMHHIVDEMKRRNVSPSDVVVAIHDAARPFVSSADVKRVFAKAVDEGAALLGQYARDTVKWVEEANVRRTIPREMVFLAQTPQVIRGDMIHTAYVNTTVVQSSTDDSGLFESLGMTVACVESTSFNGKVTTPDDLEFAEWLANRLWGV